MKTISLLDCTLRDGGYVNQWKFGKANILKIIRQLIHSGVEMIECGYLSEKAEKDENSARFCCMEDVKKIYTSEKSDSQRYALMINYGEYPAKKLPPAEKDSPIIRLAFHKKDCEGAFQYFKKLEELGYTYFVQPMGTLNYSDTEFIELINRVNSTKAEAFYVVDSFGVMEFQDFKRLMFLADNNLNAQKKLGYHSHNNLQQAYSNSQCMTELKLNHSLIIDATVFGMGRGAGNLNIELFARYLNQYFGKQYNIESFLEIFDECLKSIFTSNFWGYSLPYYLSSIHNCHPNYAAYFSEKNTLTIRSIHELLSMIPDEDKVSFSKEKANRYYLQYQENYTDDGQFRNILQEQLRNKNVLILAPGRSLNTYTKKISQFIKKEAPVIFGINAAAVQYQYDYLFISNEKRYTETVPTNVKYRILTSNLHSSGAKDKSINYSSYLLTESMIYDDPTFMLIKLLLAVGITEVTIAGFDGFSASGKENYFASQMSLGTNLATKTEKNEKIKCELQKFQKIMKMHFLTPSLYLN